MANRGIIHSVQYLRAAAALGVLVYHVSGKAGSEAFVGAAGVDVFFVVSGFIMRAVAGAKEPTPGLFLWRRFTRVAPLYWAVTLFWAAALILGHDAAPLTGTAPRLTPGGPEIAASLLFVPYFDHDGHIWPVVAQGWSLNLEMFFYVLFAVGLFILPRRPVRVVCVALVLLTALGFAIRPGGAIARTYVSPMMLEFLGGLWLGGLWQRRRLPGAWSGLALLSGGLLALVGSGLLGYLPPDQMASVPGDAIRTAVWGLPALLIVGGALALDAKGRIPRLPAALLLGDASYAIYLIQGIVISLVFKLMAGASFWVIVPVAAASPILGGVLIHRLIERPVTSWLHRARLPRRRARFSERLERGNA